MGRNGFRNALGLALTLLAAAALAQGQGGPGGRRGGPKDFGLPEDAPPILKKAFAASFRLKYSGERVVTFRRGPERRKHTEYVIKDGPRIRLEYPEDSFFAGQIVVENRGERYQYFPSSNEIHVGPAFFENSFDRLRLLLKKTGEEKVKVEVGGNETVAGVRTTAVAFKEPKGNVIQRIWIDERTGMLLKREMYDPVGSVVGSFEFTKVNFSPVIQPEDFKIVRQGAKVITAEDTAMKLVRENGLIPAFLRDRGFKLFSSRVMGRTSASKVLILTYQTKNAPLSLVQVAGSFNEENLKSLAGRMFKIHIWTLQGRTFALIGDKSEDDLKRLAGQVEVKRES